MHYYRKAAAVFLAVLALVIPVFLEPTEETAVLSLEEVAAASSHLSQLKAEAVENTETDTASLRAVEAEIMEILKTEAAQIAAENNYSSVLIDQSIYQGGIDISQKLAARIDENYR